MASRTIPLLLLLIPAVCSAAEPFMARTGEDGVQRVEIVASGGYLFTPDHIVLRVNTPVELVVRRTSWLVPHNIVIKEPGSGIEFSRPLSLEPKTITFTMKKAILAAVISAPLIIGASSAVDRTMMHEGGEGKKTGVVAGRDERRELKLPEPMKVMQKMMMRQHLSTISEITAAIAGDDLKRASEAARTLGWNPEEEKKCSMIEDLTGQKGFMDLGMAVHRKADEVADALEAGDGKKALLRLAELIENCNACHNTFRH